MSLYKKITKRNLRKASVNLLGFNWEAADIICGRERGWVSKRGCKGLLERNFKRVEDYRQSLESIQTVHMMPLLERHYAIECQLLGDSDGVTVTWMALDSPTAAEYAEIDNKNGATIAQLVSQMVLTPAQGAMILSQNKDSMFFGHIEKQDSELDNDAESLLDDLMGGDDNARRHEPAAALQRDLPDGKRAR